MGALQVARSAQFQIGFGNAETIVGIAHDINALACLLTELEWCDEDAETLVGTTAYASSELVELRESEALGVENHHDGGIRHIHTHLDHGGGDEDLGLTTYKALHLSFLLTGFHATMHLTEMELGECLFQYLVAVFQILEVRFLGFLNQREDNIDLAPLTDLLADAIVERGHTRVEDMGGSYRFTTWWQLIDDAHVEIAIKRHGEGAWDRCGSHHQYVRRILTLAPEFGSLGYSETVLLIDHNHSQTGELYCVFDDGMGAYENVDGPV